VVAQVATKGMEKTQSYWKEYRMVLSGSYLYFYQKSSDLMPQHHLFALDLNLESDMTSEGKHAIMVRLWSMTMLA